MAFLLNSQAQGVSGKNEQSTQTPWRGAQCSCIGLRPAMAVGAAGPDIVFQATSIVHTALSIDQATKQAGKISGIYF